MAISSLDSWGMRGRRLLAAFCAESGVGYRECGKLIVAVAPEEVAELERLHALGTANGVEDLRLLDGDERAAFEAIALDWLKDVLALPDACAGAFVTGATMANFTALAAARNAVVPMPAAAAPLIAAVPSTLSVSALSTVPAKVAQVTASSKNNQPKIAAQMTAVTSSRGVTANAKATWLKVWKFNVAARKPLKSA